MCITVALFGEIKSLFEKIQGRERYAWTACFVRVFLCGFLCCVCVGCECARERVGMCVCGLRVPSRESWVVFLDETTYF